MSVLTTLSPSFLVLAIITICIGGSALLFFFATRTKIDEKWSRRLKTLGTSHSLMPTNIKVAPRKISENKPIEAFLKSSRKVTNGTKMADLYGPFLTAWHLNPMNWRWYFWGGKLLGILIGSVVVVGLHQNGFLTDFSLLEICALWIVILAASSYLPQIYVHKAAQKRRDLMERSAPDVIDFLLLSIEAGMTLDHSLSEARVSLSTYAQDIAKELDQLSEELLVLPDRNVALENLVQRTGSETFRYLSVALSQGEKYGTPLVASLRLVVQESRKKNLSNLEQRAAKLPVLLSIPLMLFILPPVIVVSAGPGFVALMRSFGGAG